MGIAILVLIISSIVVYRCVTSTQPIEADEVYCPVYPSVQKKGKVIIVTMVSGQGSVALVPATYTHHPVV